MEVSNEKSRYYDNFVLSKAYLNYEISLYYNFLVCIGLVPHRVQVKQTSMYQQSTRSRSTRIPPTEKDSFSE